MKPEVTQEVLKATPPVVVAAWTLNDWVLAATLGYIALQAAYLIWKWIKEWRRK